MDPNDIEAASNTSSVDENVTFPSVAAVAKGWMFDFSFLTLCHYFKEANLEEFNRAWTTFTGIVEGDSRLYGVGIKKTKSQIAAFLSRVIHGKQLDVQFEKNGEVMPLMSACCIWDTFKDTVADKALYESIANLLFVQSVALCLEKGQSSKASSALKWLQEELDLPQNLGVKLSMLVKKNDIYHPFLLNFTFSCLLEKVCDYVDLFLKLNPSDFLFQAATKVVQSSHSSGAGLDPSSEEEGPSETKSKSAEDLKENHESTILGRSKRKLLAVKNVELWKPDSGKKNKVQVKRVSERDELRPLPTEVSRLQFDEGSPKKSLKVTEANQRRKPPQKWTYELDCQLRKGVKRHGEGKWSHILLEHDFDGRTGVMLKDRWRVLKRAMKV